MENSGQNRENEQREKILETIKEAIEKGKTVEISQGRSNGEIIANAAVPIRIEGDFLTIEADGFGFDIEVSSILNARMVEDEKSTG